MIYVLCPYGTVTGGPDALHQMVFYLNSIGVSASIVYTGCRKHNLPVPEPYQRYLHEYKLLSDIDDSEENTVISPETHTFYMDGIKHCKKYIWWLSVDNNLVDGKIIDKVFFIATLPLRFIKNIRNLGQYIKQIPYRLRKRAYDFKKEDKNITHLCASYYAYDYVSRRTKNGCYYCIEPISMFFLEDYKEETRNGLISYNYRDNVILYNPAKSGKYVKKLSEKNKDLVFKPLCKMNQVQLITEYKKAKVYIDFGPFPGAERMPKEAVLFGCEIITGRNGASGFYGDVPIPDEFKFASDKKNLDAVSDKIRELLNDYEGHLHYFDEYKHMVLKLEDGFIKSLESIFKEKQLLISEEGGNI